MSSSSSDESTGGGPSIPEGVLRSRGRGGWAGENLEMDHQREKIRAATTKTAEDDNDTGEKSYTAVDLSQFRNTEVGKGYKARHVVRQKTAATDANNSNAANIVDMSGGKNREVEKTKGKRGSGGDVKSKEEGTSRRKRSRESRKRGKEEGLRAPDEGELTKKYLQCAGLRNFRREIERILTSSQT